MAMSMAEKASCPERNQITPEPTILCRLMEGCQFAIRSSLLLKFQTSTSNFQGNSKSQAPKSPGGQPMMAQDDGKISLGTWCLELLWNLDVGYRRFPRVCAFCLFLPAALQLEFLHGGNSGICQSRGADDHAGHCGEGASAFAAVETGVY